MDLRLDDSPAAKLLRDGARLIGGSRDAAIGAQRRRRLSISLWPGIHESSSDMAPHPPSSCIASVIQDKETVQAVGVRGSAANRLPGQPKPDREPQKTLADTPRRNAVRQLPGQPKPDREQRTKAEGAGFEPALQGYRKAVFKTAAFVLSATPPRDARVPYQYWKGGMGGQDTGGWPKFGQQC